MAKRITSFLVILLGIPAVILGCMQLAESKQYYLASVVIIAAALGGLFASLEKKKLTTRELAAIACTVAIAVIGRVALFMLPQVKLTCAVVILAAISFGPYVGFLCGSMSMLVSNIFMGQGTHTPFQMFGMGLVALLCGLIFHKKAYGKNRWLVGIIGGVLCFAVYGFIVDLCSVLFFTSTPTLAAALPIFASGVSFNLVHGVTTGAALVIFTPYITSTFERISKKYELFT